MLGKATTAEVVRCLLVAASAALRTPDETPGDSPGDWPGQWPEASPEDSPPASVVARPAAPCPWCAAPMLAINTTTDDQIDVELDVCGVCQLLWFDDGELERLPKSSATAFTGPRIDEIHCGHCGAPARPDLDAYCKYCHQPMAPARTPGVTQSKIEPYTAEESDERPAATDWIGGLLRLFG